jgi:hypothetical protein
MTIYQIKHATRNTAPEYFTRKTMRFFGQTLKDFSVRKQPDGRFRIAAPMRNYEGKKIGVSVRFFNPENNKLEVE